MLPEWRELRKRSKKVLIERVPYFALAEEFTQLKKKFRCDTILDTFILWFDMVLYPLYIVYQLCMLDLSPMYVFALIKTYQLWIDWFRLAELQAHVDRWVITVKGLGGPWIACNDPVQHVFVYADGMERALLSRSLGLSKKLTKRAK